VRGEPVDHRSDIFSLGAILYEVLTGRRAFKGETTAETMAAILKEDPPDLSETNKALPPALERIARHCLEKSPEERFASARDLAFDLQALSETSAPVAKAGERRGFSAKTVAIALPWTLVVAGIGFWRGQTTNERPSPSYRALTFRRGALNAARFSPDGTYFLYSAALEGGASHLYSTRLDVPGEQALLPGRLAGVAAGEMLVLRSDGVLLRAPLSGAGAREVVEGVKAADLSHDGSRTAVVRHAAAKELLESPPGTLLYETAGEITELRFSPDGARIAFIELPNAGWIFGRVGVIDFGMMVELDDTLWELMRKMDRPLTTGNRDDRIAVQKEWNAVGEGPGEEERLRLYEQFADWSWRSRSDRGVFDFSDETDYRRGIDLFVEMVRKRHTRTRPCTPVIARETFGWRSILYRLKAKIDVASIAEEDIALTGWDRSDYARAQ